MGFACLYVVHWQNENVHPMKWNEVGDFLGGTMVGIWSLAGLVFIYVAFLGQKQQMIYQQQELDLNRKEIKQTNETLQLQQREMAVQNETAKRQQFENLFFNMIDTHLKIVADLDTTFQYYDGDTGSMQFSNTEGRDVFRDAFRLRIGIMQSGLSRISAYESLYNEKRAEFGHYYRFLYRIIDMIDKQIFSPLSDVDPYLTDSERSRIFYNRNFAIRYGYTSIVRSLLSDDELELLFYNMLYFYDLEFKPLIEKYCLLKNIPQDQDKIDNPEYSFHPGAIQKSLNPNFSSEAPPFEHS